MRDGHDTHDQQGKDVPLDEAVKFAIEEARMILPGIQALFGFQLVAVFNQRFEELFDGFQQGLHLAALGLVALSCALAMTPAAYHRQAERGRVSSRLVRLTSALIGWAMVPLMLAISIDLGLLGFAILGSGAGGVALGCASLAVFAGLWIVFPQAARRSKPETGR